MVIDVAIRKQGSIPATWLRQNWNTKRTISFNTWNSQRLSLHGSSDTTEEQCLHNPLPSLPNLPKRGLYYMGPAQGKVAQHPFYFALIFLMSWPPFLTRIAESSLCAQDRVASRSISVVAGDVVELKDWCPHQEKCSFIKMIQVYILIPMLIKV